MSDITLMDALWALGDAVLLLGYFVIPLCVVGGIVGYCLAEKTIYDRALVRACELECAIENGILLDVVSLSWVKQNVHVTKELLDKQTIIIAYDDMRHIKNPSLRVTCARYKAKEWLARYHEYLERRLELHQLFRECVEKSVMDSKTDTAPGFDLPIEGY